MNETFYHRIKDLEQSHEINNSIQEQIELDKMLKQVEHLENFYYIEKSVILD